MFKINYKRTLIVTICLLIGFLCFGIIDSLAEYPHPQSVEETATTIIDIVKPTRTPRPTITPPVIPPPQSASQTNLMIIFVILAVLIVIVGVWINRERMS